MGGELPAPTHIETFPLVDRESGFAAQYVDPLFNVCSPGIIIPHAREIHEKSGIQGIVIFFLPWIQKTKPLSHRSDGGDERAIRSGYSLLVVPRMRSHETRESTGSPPRPRHHGREKNERKRQMGLSVADADAISMSLRS